MPIQVVMEELEEEEEEEEKKSPKELEEEKNAEKAAQQKMVISYMSNWFLKFYIQICFHQYNVNVPG